MNFRTHFTFGAALSLFVFILTRSIQLAYAAFFVHLSLVFDFFLNKLFKREPFHSVTFLALTAIVAFWLNESIGLVVVIAYALHLLLDLFADEPLQLLFPFSQKKYSLYTVDRENAVTDLSILAVMVLLIVIYFLI